MSNNVASNMKFHALRFSVQASAKTLALATLLLSSSFAFAQVPVGEIVAFDNATGCSLCLTIAYCAEGCGRPCDGDVVTDIYVHENERTEFELPTGMVLQAIKLGDKLCQNTFTSWDCATGWASNSFNSDTDCCNDGRTNTVIVDGDGYSNKIYCLE